MTARLAHAAERLSRSRLATPATAAVAVAALLALCLLATGTPATSSGYIARVTNSTDSVTVAPVTCTQAAALDRVASTAILQWALNDVTLGTLVFGTTPDASGNANPGNYQSTLNGYSTATPLACPRDGGNALVFNGSNVLNGTYLSSSKQSSSPAIYSVEVWFKTTVAQGKLIGLGTSASGASATYDRHLYIDSTGKLVFGAFSSAGVVQTIASTANVTDGKWHLAVGTQSTTGGMILYLDGAQVNANATFTTAQTNNGYWRVGYDNLNGWPNPGTNFYFTGQMRFVAVYSTVLTAQQVKSDYRAGS